MAPRPPLTRPVRTTLVLAAVIAGFGLLQVIAAVFERSHLDGNAAALVAQSDDPIAMRSAVEQLHELLTLTLIGGLVCGLGGAFGQSLRLGRAWSRVTMLLTLIAGTLLCLVVAAGGNIQLLSGHLWAGPADREGSMMFLRWFPPVYYVSSMVVVIASIIVCVMLFREPLKDFVYAHRPEAGSDWDLSAVKDRQAQRTQ